MESPFEGFAMGDFRIGLFVNQKPLSAMKDGKNNI